jgi:hypothetical protein
MRLATAWCPLGTRPETGTTLGLSALPPNRGNRSPVLGATLGSRTSDHFRLSRKWSPEPLRKRENRATARFLKPSAGLEPATPSLPWQSGQEPKRAPATEIPAETRNGDTAAVGSAAQQSAVALPAECPGARQAARRRHAGVDAEQAPASARWDQLPAAEPGSSPCLFQNSRLRSTGRPTAAARAARGVPACARCTRAESFPSTTRGCRAVLVRWRVRRHRRRARARSRD